MELKRYRLGDIAKVEISGIDKKSKEGQQNVLLCNFVDVYYNWAVTKDLESKFMPATASDAEIDIFTLHKGQVAITKDSETRDDIGVATYIADDFDSLVVLGYHTALITPDEKQLCGKYLNALMHSAYFQRYWSNNASGSGQRYTLSQKVIEDAPVYLPNIDIQRKVGDFFSELDRKICLNKKENETLEALAKQIYDYWFVQFDFPDANGRPYKSTGGKMVWNETLKREIPEGWEVKCLNEVCETFLGGTPSTEIKSFWEKGTLHWLNSGEVAAFPIVDSEKKITELALQKSATTLMPKGSVTLSITRHLRASILGIDACINQSVAGIKESSTLRRSYIYPLICNEIPRYFSLRTGAQQPHINKETIDSTNIILPQDFVLVSYYRLVDDIFETLLNNALQIKEIELLNRNILPLLINGQIKLC